MKSPGSEVAPTQKPLTVDQLIAELQKIQAQGLGQCSVGVPFTPAHTTVGRSPHAPIVSLYSGFDWDAGTVFLTPSVALGSLDVESKKYAQTLEHQIGHIHFGLGVILKSTIFTPEERLAQIDELLTRFRSLPKSAPTKSPKLKNP